MVLMFTLGRLDIFPVDDLGIQQGIMFLFDFKEEGKPLKAKMEVLSQPWKPYRTLACRYLWRYKDTLKTQNV
jgi:DNA-3-methyladenine glycosylase II